MWFLLCLKSVTKPIVVNDEVLYTVIEFTHPRFAKALYKTSD